MILILAVIVFSYHDNQITGMIYMALLRLCPNSRLCLFGNAREAQY